MSTETSHYLGTLAFVSQPDNTDAPTTGERLILAVLWAATRDPWAEAPRVFASYEDLARWSGLKIDTCAKYTAALARRGALVKHGSAPGRGTEYELRRPGSIGRDPYARPLPQAEDLERRLRRLERREAKAAEGVAGKPERPVKIDKPMIKPSTIALALEHALGHVPTVDTDGVARASLPYSAKRGDCSAVAAAQTFLAAHDVQSFYAVLAGAAEHPEVLDAVAPRDDWRARARLFEHADVIEALLGTATGEAVRAKASEPSKPAPIAEPERPAAPDYRPLAAEVAAILDLDAEPLLAIVERARSQGWYVSEIVDEAKTFAAGGERPEWLTQ